MAYLLAKVMYYVCFLIIVLNVFLICSWALTRSFFFLLSFQQNVLYQGCCQLWNKLEERIATLEFDRDRKSMGVIANSSSAKKMLLVKV